MESFRNTPVVSKRVKVETQSEWWVLCRGSTTAKQQTENGKSIDEENTRKKLDVLSSKCTPELSHCPISLLISTGSQTSHNSLTITKEVLAIILRHVFGQCPRAFLYGRDPSILRFVGDLSALDTSMQIRQVAFSIFFENIEVIGQDLLAGPIRELSPGYSSTQALTHYSLS
jgi:hypothetical protein